MFHRQKKERGCYGNGNRGWNICFPNLRFHFFSPFFCLLWADMAWWCLCLFTCIPVLSSYSLPDVFNLMYSHCAWLNLNKTFLGVFSHSGDKRCHLFLTFQKEHFVLALLQPKRVNFLSHFHVISECSCSLFDCKLIQVASKQVKINGNAINGYVQYFQLK